MNEVREIPAWTGPVVAKMHVNRISYADLAAELHYTKPYISMVLTGRRTPKRAEAYFSEAVDRIVAKRSGRR